MARKERKNAAIERLDGLLGAGDWRSARSEAARLAGAQDVAEREAAVQAAARLRPDPSAILGFAGGLVVLAVIAVIGLWPR